ncbi:MAG TPA: hypothetical protein VGB01_05100, partial [candidate division Zixibacteria bacterium]
MIILKSLKFPVVIFFFSFLLIIASQLFAQTENLTEESLFQGVREELFKAKNQQVDILSPKNYKNAWDEYSLAYEKFKKGGELKEIQKRLEKV